MKGEVIQKHKMLLKRLISKDSGVFIYIVHANV
jgi:hypothetical protein